MQVLGILLVFIGSLQIYFDMAGDPPFGYLGLIYALFVESGTSLPSVCAFLAWSAPLIIGLIAMIGHGNLARKARRNR